MKWRVFVWIVRVAVIAGILYGVWCAAAYFVGKRYFRQGMIQFKSDPARAMHDFEIAVRLRPKDGRYRAALGRAALKQSDFTTAAKHLRHAARLRPDDFGIWHDLGQAHLKAGSFAGATKAFQKALEIRPDAHAVLSGLAEAALAANDSAAALEPLRKLYERAPSDLDLAAKLAQALVDNGHNDEALRVCEGAKRRIAADLGEDLPWSSKQPDEKWQVACPFLIAGGDAYRAKGRWRDAIRAYVICLYVRHGHADAVDGLSRVPQDVARRLCTDLRVRQPSFSPRDDRLAFWCSGLHVVGLPDGQPKKLAGSGQSSSGQAPAWSPDGKWICYSQEHVLRLVRPDGSGDRALVTEHPMLTQLARLGGAVVRADKLVPLQRSPAWSPDGTRIVYWADKASGAGLTCVADVATGKARSVHETTGTPPKYAAEHPPSWSADGRLICGPLHYYLDGRPTLPGLTLWSPQGRVKRQVAVPTERMEKEAAWHGVVGAACSPDARHIAVALRGPSQAKVDLAILDSAGKRGRVVVPNLLWRHVPLDLWGRWRDAKTFWMLQRTGTNPLDVAVRALICDTDGNARRVEDPFPVTPLGQWALSADGKWLAMAGNEFESTDGHAGGLWLFNLEKLRGEQE